MKLKEAFLFISIAFCACLFSCQKEAGFGDDDFPLGNSDSNYLDKVLDVEIQGSTIDTVAIAQYDYDASKRVTTITYSNESSTGPGYDISEIAKYYYTGVDTIPYKLLFVHYNSTAINDTTITYFTFSGTQRIADSSLDYIHNTSGTIYDKLAKTITTYEYVPGKIYVKSAYTMVEDNSPLPQLGLIASNSDTAILDASGNLTSYRSWDDASPFLLRYSNFTYDNHPNPFASLSNFKAIPLLPHGETFIEEMQAKNNRLLAREEDAMGTIYENDLTGKYTYKTNGYPIEINDDESPGLIYRTVFIYKNL